MKAEESTYSETRNTASNHSLYLISCTRSGLFILKLMDFVIEVTGYSFWA